MGSPAADWIKRMRHLVGGEVTPEQRAIIQREWHKIDSVTLGPRAAVSACAYEGHSPTYKPPKPAPKDGGNGSRADAAKRGRGAATAASRRAEKED